MPELEPRNPSSHTGFTMIYRKNANPAISSKTSMFLVYKMEPPCVNEPLLHCCKYVQEQCSKQQVLFLLTLSKFQSIISFLLHCGFWWSRTLWSKKKKNVSHDRLPECSREGLRARIFLSKKWFGDTLLTLPHPLQACHPLIVYSDFESISVWKPLIVSAPLWPNLLADTSKDVTY